MSDYKPRVLVDFDGVIHRYSKGWHDGTPYDEPMANARESLEHMEALGYEVVIFSTRDKDQIEEWLVQQGFRTYHVTNEKLAAIAIIDDRAITFTDWEHALYQLSLRYPVAAKRTHSSAPDWAVLEAYRASGPDDTMTDVSMKAIEIAKEAGMQ